ncbi:MAG: hypothetical protein DI533_00435 [Cereibacter sphaeroides]|uniref:Uncharacterized protein n=1 Tax=Cereibacter sphaeroides TaxID=1063 RepID=A0A2W5UMV9_CERSP|nr:MAG: hypothetical protein DI533_00435 [Cereibacter sphaeroides]
MARINKITRRDQLSDVPNIAVDTSGSLRLLAGIANEAYEFLKPGAIAKMEEQGAEAGAEMARRQMGDPRAAVSVSSMGAPSGFRGKLRNSESGGNYQAENSEGYFGAYQWGEARLADYNRATGQNITKAQFKGDADLQERAQDWHESDILSNIGDLAGRTVNGQVMDESALLGMAHLGGSTGARKYVESNGAYNPADSNGTSLSDYAARFGGSSVRVSSQSEPTVVMTPEGKVEARLYSPMSSEILQAHNAAAGIAYRSGVEVQANADLLNLSTQYAGDPSGYQAAAGQYVDQLVKDAPDMFRGELRVALGRAVGQRYLGMVEEQQRETRNRASNSNQALIERYSDTLSEAIATGSQAEIDTARGALDSALQARQSLPGLAWTPEQSFNVMADAEKRGARIVEQNAKEARDGVRSSLRTVIAAAGNGQTAADEALLDDPATWAADPDLAADAQAAVAFRDALPSFQGAPPAERKAVIEELRSRPVTDERDVKIVNAAEAANKTVTTAYESDPIAAAALYQTEKPPEIEDPSNPEEFGASLHARLQYAEKQIAGGYTASLELLSNDEAETFGALFGKETPPELKALASQTVVQALGENAARFFQEIKSNDPVTLMSGQLLARGGDPAVGMEAMRGQAMLDEGLVQKPSQATSIAAISPDTASALGQIPGAVGSEADVMAMATALYAANARGVDPTSDQAKTLMTEAVNKALGGSTNRKGEPTGGVQEVGGFPALLPPGMSGTALNEAVEGAMRFWTPLGPIAADGSAWAKAGALGAPMLEGRPLSATDFDLVQIVPVGGDMYRLQLSVNGQVLEPHPEGADNLPFIFDAKRLIEASQ